jgi:hypothetical protein
MIWLLQDKADIIILHSWKESVIFYDFNATSSGLMREAQQAGREVLA